MKDKSIIEMGQLYEKMLIIEDLNDKINTIASKFNISIEKINDLLPADPTENKQYINWLIGQLKKNLLRFPEDNQDINSTLAEFEKYKNNPLFKNNYKNDINQYKNIQDLRMVLNNFKCVNVERKGIQISGNIINNDLKIIYNKNPYTIIQLLTPKGSAIACKNSEWCVRHEKQQKNN